MTGRFDLRQDAEGWTVFDTVTCETVATVAAPRIGSLPVNAEELVLLLNRRAERRSKDLRFSTRPATALNA